MTSYILKDQIWQKYPIAYIRIHIEKSLEFLKIKEKLVKKKAWYIKIDKLD